MHATIYQAIKSHLRTRKLSRDFRVQHIPKKLTPLKRNIQILLILKSQQLFRSKWFPSTRHRKWGSGHLR